jgi:phosphate transport system substrate-binding protein
MLTEGVFIGTRKNKPFQEAAMKGTKLVAVFAALFLAVSFAAVAGGQQEGGMEGGSGEQELSGSFTVSGSSTVFPISSAMAEEFSKMYPDVEVGVQSTGTGGGFENFFTVGRAPVTGASRPIKDSEAARAAENGVEWTEFQVAFDALSVVVHPDADWVDGVSMETLAEIWGPDNPPQMWSDVDSSWPDESFEMYGPTAASGTFDFFTEEVMGETGASRDDYSKTEQDNTIIQAVSTTTNAIGYFGLAYYLEAPDRLKALAVNGVEPTIDTAASGEYPLARPIYIYVNNEDLADPAVAEYVRFYLERVDSDIIAQIGYAPAPTSLKEQQLAELEELVAAAQ